MLDAAMHLLGEVGYAALTMDEVAGRAGVSKASLYLRWSNKVALVAEAIGHHSGAVPAVPDTGSLGDDMRAFLRALLGTFRSASRALAAISGEIATNPELNRAWKRALAGQLSACVRAIVDRALARGELPPDSDVELLSILPLAILQYRWLEHSQERDDALMTRIVHQFYSSHAPPGVGRAPHMP